jgi:hypothetical protein
MEEQSFIVTLMIDPNQDVDHCQQIAGLLAPEYTVVSVNPED